MVLSASGGEFSLRNRVHYVAAALTWRPGGNTSGEHERRGLNAT